MTLTAAVIDAMVAAGATVEVLAAAIKADLAQRETQTAAKREKDAERQRRCRERHAMSRNVTVTECDSVTDPSLSRPLSPQTPLSPTHTHPEGNTRARKAADHFPKPDWADAAIWADFLANRKAKRLKNTATAYRGFLSDIANFSDADWPPGRLLEHATAKGWGAIYDPRKKPHDKPTRDTNSEAGTAQNPYARAVLARQAARAGDGSGQPDSWT